MSAHEAAIFCITHTRGRCPWTVWHRTLTQHLTLWIKDRGNIYHHQWHIKTITDSVWRQILQDNTQRSSLCAFKSSRVFTEACPTDFPLLLAPAAGVPWREVNTVQHPWCRRATSPAASLSPSLTATIWLPFDSSVSAAAAAQTKSLVRVSR